jgi:hypothetical protein
VNPFKKAQFFWKLGIPKRLWVELPFELGILEFFWKIVNVLFKLESFGVGDPRFLHSLAHFLVTGNLRKGEVL